jgi:hypothetical protein
LRIAGVAVVGEAGDCVGVLNRSRTYIKELAMRLRNAVAAAACAGLAAVGIGAPAHASTPVYGCPDGWTLEPVNYVVKQASDKQNALAIKAMDQNGDGYLCYKLLPDAIPLYQPTFLYEDNTVPL